MYFSCFGIGRAKITSTFSSSLKSFCVIIVIGESIIVANIFLFILLLFKKRWFLPPPPTCKTVLFSSYSLPSFDWLRYRSILLFCRIPAQHAILPLLCFCHFWFFAHSREMTICRTIFTHLVLFLTYRHVTLYELQSASSAWTSSLIDCTHRDVFESLLSTHSHLH